MLHLVGQLLIFNMTCTKKYFSQNEEDLYTASVKKKNNAEVRKKEFIISELLSSEVQLVI